MIDETNHLSMIVGPCGFTTGKSAKTCRNSNYATKFNTLDWETFSLQIMIDNQLKNLNREVSLSPKTGQKCKGFITYIRVTTQFYI